MIWLRPGQERPRYMTDFEQVLFLYFSPHPSLPFPSLPLFCSSRFPLPSLFALPSQEAVVGAGHFSSVFRARSRLDGCLYGIKRLNSRCEGSRSLLLKEVHALAALQGCDHIVRYYGCWIEGRWCHDYIAFFRSFLIMHDASSCSRRSASVDTDRAVSAVHPRSVRRGHRIC
jgi:hypothetical protein